MRLSKGGNARGFQGLYMCFSSYVVLIFVLQRLSVVSLRQQGSVGLN